VAIVLVTSDTHPYPADARRNWDRLEGTTVDRIHAANDRDVRYLLAGREGMLVVVRAARQRRQRPVHEPILSAGSVIRAREAGSRCWPWTRRRPWT
jgi:hypothetical protein